MNKDQMLEVLAKFFRISFAEDGAGVAQEMEGLGVEDIDAFITSLDEIVPE